MTTGRVAQATIIRVPHPSFFCLGGDSSGSALSHASVTGALVREPLGGVSPNCGDEVVVCSVAAPSVRAGKAL